MEAWTSILPRQYYQYAMKWPLYQKLRPSVKSAMATMYKAFAAENARPTSARARVGSNLHRGCDAARAADPATAQQLRDAILQLHGYAASTVLRFPYRQSARPRLKDCIVVRWDAATKTFEAVSGSAGNRAERRRDEEAALPLDAHLASELHFGYELRETSGLLLKRSTAHRAPRHHPHAVLPLTPTVEGEGINQSELSERLATTQPRPLPPSTHSKGALDQTRARHRRPARRTHLSHRKRPHDAEHLAALCLRSLARLRRGRSSAEVAKLRSLLARVRENLEGELAIDEPAERGA